MPEPSERRKKTPEEIKKDKEAYDAWLKKETLKDVKANASRSSVRPKSIYEEENRKMMDDKRKQEEEEKKKKKPKSMFSVGE